MRCFACACAPIRSEPTSRSLTMDMESIPPSGHACSSRTSATRVLEPEWAFGFPNEFLTSTREAFGSAALMSREKVGPRFESRCPLGLRVRVLGEDALSFAGRRPGEKQRKDSSWAAPINAGTDGEIAATLFNQLARDP